VHALRAYVFKISSHILKYMVGSDLV